MSHASPSIAGDTGPVSNADTASIAAAFDVTRLPAEFYVDPYPYYRALRCHTPIKTMADGSRWLTRYDDMLAVYRDARTFSSDKKIEFGAKYGPSPLLEHHTTSLVFSDPPMHTHVRHAIVGALSQRHIAAMETGLVALVDDLLDRLGARAARDDEIDLVADFAAAIPIGIIGNLLGIPAHRREPLRGWSLAILGALEPVLTTQRAVDGNRAVTEMLAYLKALVDERRAHLRDPDTDVLTRLLIGEDSGGRLSEAQLLHQCIFLLNAGHETTTNLIGNALHALSAWREQKAYMIQHLGDVERMKLAVEEFLRFDGPVQLGNRLATRDVEVGGVAMPAGARITMCIGAANRDPGQFAEPDRLDLTRVPNRHVAFAFGIHTCAGINLARLEGRVALARFLARFPGYCLTGEPVRDLRARFRGFVRLPARLQ